MAFDQQRSENNDLKRFLYSLPEDERRKYLADRKQVLADQPPPPQNAPQAPGRPFATGGRQVAMTPIQAAYATQGPHVQAAALQGAIDNTMDAWKAENDSRVAQMREMRRMQHEKDIEAMRQEGLLRRLAAAQAGAPESVFPQDVNNQGMRYKKDPGGMMRIFNPDTMQFDYTNEFRAGGY